MSEENKVYIEAYECLWEVYDPQFGDDGTVRSSNWRMVGDEDFTTDEGTFTGAVVYEDLGSLLQRVVSGVEAQAEAEGCTCDPSEGEACSDCPEAITVPVEATYDAVAFTGPLGESIRALLDIAHSEEIDASVRFYAADRVLRTYLDVLGL